VIEFDLLQLKGSTTKQPIYQLQVAVEASED
jgi:hypothetical protein